MGHNVEPSRTKSSFKTANNLYRANFVASLAKDAGSIAACPPAAAAAAIVVRILDTEVKNNQESCERLAKRCTRILTDVTVQMKDRWGSAPKPLIKNLEKFCQTLGAIHHYMQLQQGKTWFKRFLTKGTIEETIQDFDLLLTQASRNFQMSTLIDIHYTVGSTGTESSNDDDETLCSSGYAARCDDMPEVDSPIDETKFHFFQEQPEYDFHVYTKRPSTKKAQDNVHEHFRFTRFADVHSTRPLSFTEEHTWWSEMSEAEVCGRAMVIKGYVSDSRNSRKKFNNDVNFLATLFHPNFPQMISCSLKNSPVSFLLIEPVQLMSTQESFLERLPSASREHQAEAWGELALHFFHQLKDAAEYMQETFKLGPNQILGLLDELSPAVHADDHLMLGLPCPRPGHVSAHRNFGVMGGLRIACMHMLPSISQANARLDVEKTFYELLAHVRSVLWAHFQPNPNMVGLGDEACDCDDSAIRLLNENERPWVHYDPIQLGSSSTLGVGDLGYIPDGHGVESFVKVANLVQEGLDVAKIEELRSGTIDNGSSMHTIEPISSPNEAICWKVGIRPYQRLRGEVATTAQLTDEQALRNLSDWSSKFVGDVHVQPQELRLITAVEKGLKFDVSWFKEQPTAGEMPKSLYLHTLSEHSPFVSLGGEDKRGLHAGDGFACTLNRCYKTVHLVGLAGIV